MEHRHLRGDDLARNYGFEQQAAHEDRYRGAEEFVEVVTRLWDSWDDDAVVVDKEAGVFIDDTRVHPIDHRGDRFTVAGPLDVPRSPQGHPVRVQAGSSPRGRDFAARHAEAIFTAQLTLAGAQEFYGDIRERVASHGRDPDRVKVLPGLVPIVGETEDDALAVHERLERHASMTSGLSMLSFVFGVDMSGLDLDAPLPRAIEDHQAQGHQSRSALLVDFAREHGLTVRELIGRTSGGRGHRVIIGDPIADRRLDAGVVRGRRRRRLQPHAAHAAGEPGGLRGPRRARAAAARDLPDRVRGAHPARPLRAGAPGPRVARKRACSPHQPCRIGRCSSERMSFRNRLTLFFVLIVIVPMVAVAVVLFRLISDNEDGKANARLAAEQNVAINMYKDASARALATLGRVASDEELSAGLQDDDLPAARTRAVALLGAEGARRIVLVRDNAGR